MSQLPAATPPDPAAGPAGAPAPLAVTIRGQYLLLYAMGGTMFPYFAVYLREQGLTSTQVGQLFAAGCVPMLFTPFSTTLLADTRVRPLVLLCWLYVLGSLALVGVYLAQGFAAILAAYLLFRVVFTGTMPLLDGVHFSIQAHRRRHGLPEVGYHRIRVWGSVGWMLPAAVLYVPLALGMPTGLTILLSAAMGVVGMAEVVLRRRPLPAPSGQGELPSLAAARALWRPPLRMFAMAMFILWLGITAHATFYPLYLKEQLGVPDGWIGLLSTFSVLVEIGFVLAYRRLLGRLGLRGLMLLGVATAALRLGLLAAFPNLTVAVLTQFCHGPWVLSLFIIPPQFLDRNATGRFRHSIQGLYSMLIGGGAVITGNLACGWIKEHLGMAALFAGAAACAVVAFGLLLVAFSEEHLDTRPAETAPPPEGAAEPATRPLPL
jgi:PPP family 3-phenylpropionic acid transporter